MKLMIIFGSSRAGRKGEVVANWVNKHVTTDGRFEIDYVDPRVLKLPFFDEPISPFSMKSLDDYTHPEGRAWAERIAATEGVILITPEYNHGTSAVMKNMLDWAGPPWVDKPVGLISYGGISGGTRAVEQLRSITIELGLINVANAIHFPFFVKNFDENGNSLNEERDQASLKKMFDEIIRIHAAFEKT